MNRTTLFSSAIFIAVVAVGCASPDQEPHFVEAREDCFAAKVFDAQLANGARDDATLHPAHFMGDGLSSLGEQKTRLMAMAIPGGRDFTVYMNLKADSPLFVERSEAVAAAFTEAGFDAERHLRIEQGTNPATLQPTAAGLAALQRAREAAASTDSETFADSGVTSDAEGAGQESSDVSY
ncbi:MAG: hypothetical protein ACFCVE_03245 [Phycisphaerae bacterium]